MSDALPPDLTAALADRYTLVRELGAGGMATVYLATDLKHNRPVAVKVLRPELAAVVGAERFLSEIETTANLQHPHILPLFDSGEVEGFLFYVMPFVEGESLRERLERERQLPVDQAIEITRKVASALQHAHERGIVHRDVKPANILLSQGEPLVADFGIALAVSSAGGGRVTETGLSLGTPHYMSPEQASGDRSLDPRSDVYALGCVCYEMLTGEPPFPGPTPQSVLARILTSQAQRVTMTRHTVPRHVDAAVARALEKLPADRFESVADFRRALDDPDFRHAGAQGEVGAPAAAPAASREGARTLLPAALGVAALSAVVAAVGWLRPLPEAPYRRVPVRLEGAGFDYGPGLALARDGSMVAYDRDGPGLALRRLSSEQVQELAVGENARTPFFSPDGLALGYHVGSPGNTGLKWISLSGGNAIEVADEAYPGGTWSADGFVYFTNAEETLWRARPEGAEPEKLPQPEGTRFRWIRAAARGAGPGR